MPLSEPVAREPLHRREIDVHGYRRADGLFDIEAHLTDRKSYGFSVGDKGWLAPNEPVHDMWVRMTVRDDLLIVGCEAVTEQGPYAICPTGAQNFSLLAGLTIRPGFLRAANERVGGVAGCTHLRELLQQMATVAFQTSYSVRERDEAIRSASEAPPLLNTCTAFASDGPVVKRRWPEFYSGKQALGSETGALETGASETRASETDGSADVIRRAGEPIPAQ